MSILGLIPARGGSKGIPRKNIKLLGDRELIRYSIQSALRCSLIDKVVVSTDDSQIAHIGKAAGAEVPFIRPAELAADSSPTIDTVLHALLHFQKSGTYFDGVCLLQPTVPFRDDKDLYTAVSTFLKEKPDSLISVRKVPHHFNPYWVFVSANDDEYIKKAHSEFEHITRRQDLPSAYYRDGAVYITNTKIVMDQKSLYGKRILPYEMERTPDINLDTMEDWNKAEAYVKNHLNG